MSAPLERAKLIRLKDGPKSGPTDAPTVVPDDAAGSVVDVQFNPTTLKLQRSNNVDSGGATTNSQVRHSLSSGRPTLTFDLEFDTAEGESGRPRDVQELTRAVRQFVAPPAEPAGTAPPRVRFVWGSFAFNGIIVSLGEEYDYFSPRGSPLRARLSVSMSEQDLRFEAGRSGAPARTATTSRLPGAPGNAPGQGGTTTPAVTALAQAGESVPQLLTRLGRDPAGWRAAMNGLDSPLALAAGAEVQLDAGVGVGASLGGSAGFAAAAGGTAGLSAALGLSASGGLGARVDAGAAGSVSASGSASVSAATSMAGSASAEAGFVLSAGGGIDASLACVQATATASATADARAAFGVPAPPAAAGSAATGPGSAGSAGRSGSAGSGARGTGARGTGARGSVREPAVAPDPRALAFGRGIPLRARRATPR